MPKKEAEKSCGKPVLQGTEPIFECFGWLSEIFEKIEDPDMKKALKTALVDEEILKIEAAVSMEARILSMDSESDERKRVAVQRIEEGMDYWQRKIVQRVSGARQ